MSLSIAERSRQLTSICGLMSLRAGRRGPLRRTGASLCRRAGAGAAVRRVDRRQRVRQRRSHVSGRHSRTPCPCFTAPCPPCGPHSRRFSPTLLLCQHAACPALCRSHALLVNRVPPPFCRNRACSCTAVSYHAVPPCATPCFVPQPLVPQPCPALLPPFFVPQPCPARVPYLLCSTAPCVSSALPLCQQLCPPLCHMMSYRQRRWRRRRGNRFWRQRQRSRTIPRAVSRAGESQRAAVTPAFSFLFSAPV